MTSFQEAKITCHHFLALEQSKRSVKVVFGAPMELIDHAEIDQLLARLVLV